ncbi:hypothetical protein ED388_04500 [Muribaculaceae bacterium Isolate-007 (NCI)]|nr:hypothetical protein EEL42_03225 [Muribaculaceae bacterium Isolate-100 (HZI)]RXE66249.1 hypothetical protein ED388_04500 [Muribaculaceae bacterium Isolate-007 (NCI)]
MEQSTPYRYEAKNDGSYNELAAYAALLMGNVSLFPELRVIVIDGRFANDVGKFIDNEGLDFYIAPIEVDDDNLLNLINTAAVDVETLRKIAYRLIEQTNSMAEKHNNIIAEITAADENVKKDRDYYRELYLKYANKSNRIKEQIRAIGTLVDSIFPKE